jgi:aromatic ring-opening dioxygenase LigB subunit
VDSVSPHPKKLKKKLTTSTSLTDQKLPLRKKRRNKTFVTICIHTISFARDVVLKAVNMETGIFWDVTPCSLEGSYQVSEEPAEPIFIEEEDEGSRFLRNAGNDIVSRNTENFAQKLFISVEFEIVTAMAIKRLRCGVVPYGTSSPMFRNNILPHLGGEE